jgi:CheY-like chemotaxis protein
MSTRSPLAPEPSPAHQRPVVLIVDDRAENLLALEAVLEPLDVHVERASSGEGAACWPRTPTT